MGGWPGGNPTERASSRDVAQPDRPRVLDERTQQSLALGQVADPARPRRRRMPTWMNSVQPAVRRDHAERAVRRVDQLAGRLDDPAQHRLQARSPMTAGGAQQAAQPALGGHHLLRPLDQLGQQLVQLEARQVRNVRLVPSPAVPAASAPAASEPAKHRSSGSPATVRSSRSGLAWSADTGSSRGSTKPAVPA